MRRVLVTGARGYVGRGTVQPLRDLGLDVIPAGRAEADLLRPGAPAALIAATRPTHLLHLAWTTAHGRYWTDPANTAWVEATARLLEAFAGAGGERAVTVGSCAELIAAGCMPATLYGEAKAEMARRAAALAAARGFGHAHARLFFSYGAHEHPDRLAPTVIRALLAGERARLTPGEQVRDFLDVRDVGRALAHLVAGDAGGTVDVGSGEPVSVAEVARRIGALVGRPELIGLGDLPPRPGDPERLVADVRALAAAGFAPRHRLDAGLADAIAWWRGRLSASRP